ncbi:hypothetical protein ABYF34_07625 [Buchananella felis]|uniref:hypothetical protein n=1 Tax=Buchananella felis TaxID=3231492 RepID=UPI0035291287
MSTKAERLAAARLALAQAEQRAGLNVLRPRFGRWGKGALPEGAGASPGGEDFGGAGSGLAGASGLARLGVASPQAAGGAAGGAASKTKDGAAGGAKGGAKGSAAGEAKDRAKGGAARAGTGLGGPGDGWEYLIPVERRQVVAVAGSTSLFLHALARLQEGRRWCAVVGHPGLGWCAAQEAGVNLAAVLAVPQVGERAIRVLTALAEGVEVLAVGPGVRLSGREQRFLAGKVRERGGALVAVGAWEGAWQLEAASSAPRFLGRAEGYVAGGSWRVRVPKRPELGEVGFTVAGGKVAWEGGERGVDTRVGVRVGT